ncbi:type II secretion system F family protein [bacterium]|nr:type II secretion system F family protein [bacterium]
MTIYLLLSSVFFGFFLLMVTAAAALGRKRHPVVERVNVLRRQGSPIAALQKTERFSRSKDRMVGTASEFLKEMGFFARPEQVSSSRMRSALIYAGIHGEDSVKIFAGIKMVCAASFFLVFLLLGLFAGRPFPVVLMLSLFVSFGGFILPDVILNSRIRRRQEQIAASFPDAIDLLVISVEAGLGLNAALLRVGADLSVRCKPIAEEFARVNQDLRTGVSREKALRNLSERNRVEDLRIFISALILADRLGTSIADTLRAQADSLRTRIRQKAEEQAARAGIKMLFPLVFFILPALIIILMGPAMISLINTFRR